MVSPYSYKNKRTPIIPFRGYCLVETIDEQKKSASGLTLPDTLQEKQVRGRVISIGNEPFLPNGEKVAWEIEEGDIIWFKRFGGEEVSEGENKYILVPSIALLGKVIQYD